MKRFLSLLLIITMGLFIIPVGVFAKDDDDGIIYVSDGENVIDVYSGGEASGVEYDADNGVLTLNNYNGRLLYISSVDVEVVLKGENTITGVDSSTLAVTFKNGDFEISGDGTLNINAYEDEHGLVIEDDGNLTINGGTINIAVSGNCYGILDRGRLVLNDGTLNIENDGTLNIESDEGSNTGFELKAKESENTASFEANGGEINLSGFQYGFNLRGVAKFSGADISVTDCSFGIMSYLFTYKLYITAGNIHVSADVMGLALQLEDDENRSLSDYVEFNDDKLSLDNPEYAVRKVVINTGEDTEHQQHFIIVGPEDAYFNNEGHNFAKAFDIFEKKTYKVVEGDKQKVYQSAKAIKIDADLDKFVALYINDELVDESNYDLEEGSTIIKLKEEYTKKLSAGNYKFKAVFTDGIAEGEFTVTTENPETGDNIITYIALLILSIGALVMIRKRA